MNFSRKSTKAKPFLIKTAGGASSQTLGLMNGIYVSQRIGRPFTLRHYPFSTGSYYPIAINRLLRASEMDLLEGQTKGLKVVEVLEVGKVINQHPLLAKRFSYEKLLVTIRRFNLEKSLLKLRGEWPIYVSESRLRRTPKNIKCISGGYFPTTDRAVHDEMNRRFESAQILSPFKPRDFRDLNPGVVIHYRIGDKRGSFAFPELGIDGIVDPESFKEILELEDRPSNKNVYVVSDEPMVAKKLLDSVGIVAKVNPVRGDLWSDLYLMTRADLLICPWSMVSQLAASIVASHGRKVYYPKFTSFGSTLQDEIPGVSTYIPKFLPRDHAIYKDSFDLEAGSHLIYQKEDNSSD